MKYLFLFIGCLGSVFLSACQQNTVTNRDIPSSPTVITIGSPSTQQIEASVSCISDNECGDGFLCFNSQYSGMGPNGVVVGEQLGDLLCHKICTQDSDCTTGTCQETNIIGGDIVVVRAFCR